MNQESQHSAIADQLAAVQDRLAEQTHDAPLMDDIALSLVEVGEQAREAALDDIYQGADVLARLAELAAGWLSPEAPEAELASSLIEFLSGHLPTMAQAVTDSEKSSDIESFVQQAEQDWAEYLSVGSADPLTDDAWELAESEYGDDFDDESPLEDDQIQLMLGALGGSSATESGAADPQPEPTSVDSAAAESTDAAEAVSTELFATRPEDSGQTELPTPPANSDQAARAELASDRELLEAYLDDALRCLSSMEQAAMELEENASEKEHVRQFCRELHTLKGASGTVGLSDLASYLHQLESYLEVKFSGDAETFEADPLFAAVDCVREVIGSLQNEESSAPAPTPNKSLPAARNAAPVRAPQKPDFANFGVSDDASIRIRASKLDKLMDMLAELVVLRNRREGQVSEFNELNEELARCAARVSFADEQWDDSPTNEDAESRSRNTSNMSEVSKDITAVSLGLRDLQKPAIQTNAAISRFISDFRHELMQLRRVPVNGLFTRLQRAARDAAKSEGKKVQVKLGGEHAGLEQEIQEKLFDSLLHVVRNSVSHGIESTEQREKSGKDPVGTITLDASSNAQLLIIEVRDDGGGINYEAVRRRAIEKELLASHHHATNDELARLIFHPGFSTKEKASEISGRGVGMDVVATTIEQLHGRIEVESTEGQGTTIRLLIPLRSGIEHVMVFRAGDQLFALPMQSILAAKNPQSVTSQVSLANALGLSRESDAGSKGDVLMVRRSNHLGNPGDDEKSGNRLAIAVDELVGPEEVVVRGLPHLLRHHPLFCGVTLSGSGKKVLLLDAERVAAFCELHHEDVHTPQDGPEDHDSQSDKPKVLIVDDSLTARKVLGKILRQHGLQVIEAGDGIEAVERLHRETFDLVMTDLDMPRMGGLELLSDIQSGQYCKSPLVVVSSRSEEAFRDKAAEVGANEYITKPVSETSVRKLLEQFELLPQSVKG